MQVGGPPQGKFCAARPNDDWPKQPSLKKSWTGLYGSLQTKVLSNHPRKIMGLSKVLLD